MIGIGFPYIFSATIEARARKESIDFVRIAAGAVPALTDSRSTAVVVDEPFVKGKSKILPEAIFPDKG
jgi:malic enzyme